MTTDNYNKEKVECCIDCKSLQLWQEGINIICKDCLSVNRVEVLTDIEEYEKKYGYIWKYLTNADEL